MADVRFVVRQPFPSPAREVWDELIDWKGHEAWIPATKVEIHGDGDPTAPGSEFTATTGFGPLTLADRMTVVHCRWDDDQRAGDCEVRKHGPVLFGRAAFTVAPAGVGSEVVWIEEVTVRRLPGVLAPVARWAGSLGFKMGMRKLAKQLAP